MSMRYSNYRKNGEQRFVKYIIRTIIALIILMLIIVVHDRFVFHKQVYDSAISEINAQKKAHAASATLDTLYRRGIFEDTISKPVQISASSSDARNHNEMSQTVNINNPDPIKQITEDITSTIDTLKETDGLISANGITYLISLIVALLIALVSDKVLAVGKQMSLVNDLIAKSDNYIQEQISELDDKIEDKIQQKLKSNTILIYNHTTNYNNILNRVVSLYNHTILIDITLSSAEVNDRTSHVIDLLNSRVNLIYDGIMNRFNDKKYSLEFVTLDEQSLLYTYIEDALYCLNMNFKTVITMNDDYLQSIIQDKINIIEEIKDKIDAIEIQENIYSS